MAIRGPPWPSDAPSRSLPCAFQVSTIAAERRWVLSGTPTVGTDVKKSLAQLHNLLRFLREPEFGLGTLAKFMQRVGQPFLADTDGARARLLALLRPLMVRHTKKDLRLPEPVWLPEQNLCLPWDPSSCTEQQWVSATCRHAAEHIVASLAEPRRCVEPLPSSLG